MILQFLLPLKPIHSFPSSKTTLFICVLALLDKLCSHKCFVTKLHSSCMNSEGWQHSTSVAENLLDVKVTGNHTLTCSAFRKTGSALFLYHFPQYFGQ